MHSGITADDEPMAEMNLIPLIDIALTLLIIMMVTTAFVHKPGVSLRLPETVTREGAPETQRDMTVVVGADGGYYVNARKLEPAELQLRLQGMGMKNRQARILVKGDRDVAYARIMDVMDMVRQAGLTRIVLPTDPKLAQPGAPTTATTGPALTAPNGTQVLAGPAAKTLSQPGAAR